MKYMKTKTIRYGLRYKKDGKLLGFETERNPEGSESVSFSYHLSYGEEDRIWLVESPEHAEFVRQNSTPWYNADYECPMNDFDVEELQVVRVITVINEAEVCVKIPTFEEYMEYRYNTKEHKFYDPAHYTYYMNEYRKAKGTGREKEFQYSIYDLNEYLREKKEETKLVVEKA